MRNQVIVVPVCIANRVVHRASPDLSSVDHRELIVHGSFAPDPQDWDTSLDHFLNLVFVEIVAVHNYADGDASLVSIEQSISDTP